MQPKTTQISAATAHTNDGMMFKHDDDYTGNLVVNEPKEKQPKVVSFEIKSNSKFLFVVNKFIE